MSTLSAASRRIVGADSDQSLSSWARARRWRWFIERFPGLADMRVADLGGTVRSWRLAPVRPRYLVAINNDPDESPELREDATTDWARTEIADACELPDALRREDFDLVYSNSVLEHVGGYARRRAFAASVYALGRHHWIQTPYRYFPVEPHWLFPGFQHLPVAAKAEVAARWPVGNYARLVERDVAVQRALETELVSATEMRHLFPAGCVEHERVLGLTKSLIAVA